MADFYCKVCTVRRVARDGDVCPGCMDDYQSEIPASKPDPITPQTGAQTRNRPNPANPQTGGGQSGGGNPQSGPSIVRPSRRGILNQPAGAQQPTQQSGRQIYVAPAQNDQQDDDPGYVSAGSTVVTPVSSGHTGAQQPTQTAAKGKNAPQCEGIVRNVQESKDGSSVLERWMRSFSTSTPFPLTDDMIEFQVFSGWNSGTNASGHAADKVIVYGTINSGKPVQDNSVRVYGTRNKGNAIIASSIENTTDGTFAEFKPEPIPAGVVKVVTFAVLGLIALIVYSVFTMGSGLGGLGGLNINMDGVTNFLIYVAMLVGSVLAMIYLIKKFFKDMKAGNSDLFMTLVSLLIAFAVMITALENMF